MKSFNEYKSGNSIGSFFGKSFAVRQNAHILHLSSKSYAEHKALGSFYEQLTDLTDQLIETYQGQYGLVEVDVAVSKEKNAVSLLNDFAEDAMNSRDLFDKKDTHLHNILDEILSLTYQTLYKLKFLK